MVVVIVSEIVGSTGHMHSGRSKNCHRDSNSRGNNKMMVLVICGRKAATRTGMAVAAEPALDSPSVAGDKPLASRGCWAMRFQP